MVNEVDPFRKTPARGQRRHQAQDASRVGTGDEWQRKYNGRGDDRNAQGIDDRVRQPSGHAGPDAAGLCSRID